MSDNGEIKPEEQKQGEVKPLQMIIDMSVEGKLMVHFPLLNDKIATYGFLKAAEKTLDKHYSYLEQSKIIKTKGSILDFARRRN